MSEARKLENEISVGIIFVESQALTGGPTFTQIERQTLQQEIIDGLTWLANYEPSANISWVFNWQFTRIRVANGTGKPKEDYWRNPAMTQVNYFNNTYTGDWNGIRAYRDDMRTRNSSAHAVVVFVTPYANEAHAYANEQRITLANKNNWGGWGINNIDSIIAHEMCHVFGAIDEYTGEGTPCSSCGGEFGIYNIPNGNCGSCALPHQVCIMDQNTFRICAYTQGQIGWADLFVELTTADELGAGTDDNVWLYVDDQIFLLDTPDHNDREQGNINGYAFNYTKIYPDKIKKVGIKKAPDSIEGAWKLKKVRIWCQGKLIVDTLTNVWLEKDNRFCALLGLFDSEPILPVETAARSSLLLFGNVTTPATSSLLLQGS